MKLNDSESHMRVSLYRLYDAEDVLLYVGVTLDLKQRLNNHATQQPWWLEVARIKVTHLSSREDSETLERAVIQLDRPKYNVTHNRNRMEIDIEQYAEIENARRERLLIDLQQVWGDAPRRFTVNLLTELKAYDARWGSETGRSLARVLATYNVHSTTIREGERVGKRYRKQDIMKLWEHKGDAKKGP